MNRRALHAAMFIALATMARGSSGRAQPAPADSEPPTGPWNLPAKTFGGKQFWADQWFFHDWRIQRNAVTGHHRLLDTNDWRHAWGSFEACRAKLDRIRHERQLPPMRGEAVLVLHGLGRSRGSMKKMAAMLREKGDYTVFNISYPSTRHTVAEHAQSLARIIESLDGITKINFVCHSLGNLVVRHWLADRASHPTPAQLAKPIGRMVMLGPPNHRPELAATAAKIDFTGQIGGKTLAELAKHWDQLEPHLATPDFEFAILAGGKGDGNGYNPLIPGDDDLVVSVASTMLSGANDFRVVPVMHTFMMDDTTVQEYTLRFLKFGWLEEKHERKPLP